jgi:dihydrofolate reductase
MQAPGGPGEDEDRDLRTGMMLPMNREASMRKLTVFNLMTLDGYIAGPGGDISWHNVDEEFQELATAASNSGNTLLFGRVTYELMAGFWPTPEAIRTDPVVASGMNRSEKIVFSRTLQKADWNNTRLVKDDMLAEVRRLKQLPGKDLTILGSGSIVSQLAQEGLVDEYDILLNPVVLGKGKTMFEGLRNRLVLKLKETRKFGNGNMLLKYEPVR